MPTQSNRCTIQIWSRVTGNVQYYFSLRRQVNWNISSTMDVPCGRISHTGADYA